MSIQLNLGFGGKVLKADPVAGEEVQLVKLDIGATGATSPVTTLNPLPVSDAAGSLTVDTPQLPATLGAKTTANSTSVTLSTNHAALPLPTGAATEATLAAASAKLPAALGAQTTAGSMSVTLSSNHANVPVAVQSAPDVAFTDYDSSLFGGIRAHHDLVVFERLHEYPGPSTAYEPDFYDYAKDAGSKGSIAFEANHKALTLSVSDNTADAFSRLASRGYIRYQPGAMPIVQLTAATTHAATTLKFVRRSSATGSVVDNVMATLNGITATNYNRYEIRFAYLGVQAVAGFINGTLVHLADFGGALTVPYLKTPILPLRVEVVNSSDGLTQYVRFGLFDNSDGLFWEWSRAAAGSCGVNYKCASVRIAGGGAYPYFSYGFSQATTGVSTTLIPLWSLRAGSTINTVASKAMILPKLLTFFAESQPGALELVLDGTLTGATWAATSPSAAVQIDTAATVITGGSSIWRTGHGANVSDVYDLEPLFNILGRKIALLPLAGTSNILTFAVVREGTVNFSPRVSLTWNELR